MNLWKIRPKRKPGFCKVPVPQFIYSTGMGQGFHEAELHLIIDASQTAAFSSDWPYDGKNQAMSGCGFLWLVISRPWSAGRGTGGNVYSGKDCLRAFIRITGGDNVSFKGSVTKDNQMANIVGGGTLNIPVAGKTLISADSIQKRTRQVRKGSTTSVNLE